MKIDFKRYIETEEGERIFEGDVIEYEFDYWGEITLKRGLIEDISEGWDGIILIRFENGEKIYGYDISSIKKIYQ